MPQLQLTNRDLLIAAVLTVGLAGWFAAQWWNRPPVIEQDNLKYIQLLMTAISSQSPEQLEKVELSIRKRFEAKQMSDREYAALRNIAAQARSGEWEPAYKACFVLAEGQLSRRRAQPATGDSHSHEHGNGHEHHH